VWGLDGGQSGFNWCVCDQDHAAFKRIYTDESKIRAPIQVFEQALALIHDNRVNKYSILVDEPRVCKRLDKCRAAERNNVATVGLFYLSDLLFNSGTGELCRRFELSPLETLKWMVAGYDNFWSTVDLFSYT
jgi:hypothetical protein